MKKWLCEQLVCPACQDQTTRLTLAVVEEKQGDVIEGDLSCPSCGSRYPINEGVAVMLPTKSMGILCDVSGYNSRNMLSSYLWSHYAEFFNGANATDAYRVWSSHFQKTNGIALDIGCSVGRLSFELSKTHSKVIGIDTSVSFIKKARELLTQNRLEFDLIIEGYITKKCSWELDKDWNFDRIEFIIADALALPFPSNHFSTVASINVLEKVASPIQHLRDVNKVLREEKASFVFSDPFSWDESVSDPDEWLSGRNQGKYKGRGIDTLSRILSGEDGIFDPPLKIREKGDVVWKIRKTENLWEHIHSQFIIGERSRVKDHRREKKKGR